MAHKEDIKSPRREAYKKEDYKSRKCLRCQVAFNSLWIGNRICAPCKTSSVFHGDSGTYLIDTGKR